MDEYWPLVAALSLIAYLALKARLNRLAQPLRIQLAEVGERLLAEPGLPPARRNMIEFELEGAFGRSWKWLVAFAAIPFMAVWIAATWNDDGGIYVPDDALRGRTDDFDDLAARIDMMNHPILMPLIYIWLGLWFIPAAVFAAIFGRAARILTPPRLLAAMHAR